MSKGQQRSFNDWLLDNTEYIRDVQDSGDGSYRITPPRDAMRDADIDDGTRLVVLPSDIAGQIGTTEDPLFEIYELPLER